jgi:hypothetical protein
MFQVAMEKGMLGIPGQRKVRQMAPTGTTPFESQSRKLLPAAHRKNKPAALEARPGLAPGFAEIQVRPSREWWVPRTGAERTFGYVSTGSGGNRHSQAGLT